MLKICFIFLVLILFKRLLLSLIRLSGVALSLGHNYHRVALTVLTSHLPLNINLSLP